MTACRCTLAVHGFRITRHARGADVVPLLTGCQLAKETTTSFCTGPTSRRWRPAEQDPVVVGMVWASLVPGDQVRQLQVSEDGAFSWFTWWNVDYADVFDGALLVSLTGYGQRHTFRPDPGGPVMVARHPGSLIGGSMDDQARATAVALVAAVLGGTETTP